MARHSSFPIEFDSCKTLEIGFLRKHNYLLPGHSLSGTISWSRQGQVTSRISVSIEMGSQDGIATFSYLYRGENVSYTVEVIARKSNLGKGFVYYFLCPFTFKACRKLYLINGRFTHREAVKDGYYESQLMSHSKRQLWKLYGIHFIPDKVYEQRFTKYFKPTYKGQPTKKMLKLQRKLDFYNRVKDRIPSEEQLLLM